MITDPQPDALEWAQRNNLLALDLGAAHGKPEGYVGIDSYRAEGVDLVGEIFDVLKPMFDGSVGVVRAVDYLPSVPDKIRLMNELHRVLTPGGFLLTLTPSSDGRGAFQDPAHVSYWNENSFYYYSDPEFAKYVPEITARFQILHLATYFPSEWNEEHDVPYVMANLLCVKDEPTPA